MIDIKKFNKEGIGSFYCIIIGDGFLVADVFFLGIDIANILQHSNLTQARKRLCKEGEDFKIFKSKENTELFKSLKKEKIIGNKCSSICLLTSKGVVKLAFNNETITEKINFIEWLKELNILDKNAVLFKSTDEQEFGSILEGFLKEQCFDVERQYVIGNYRLDFFIRRFNFCIELDGVEHIYKRFQDSQRDSYLREEEGILTVRVKSGENYGKAIAQIQETLINWMRSECFD